MRYQDIKLVEDIRLDEINMSPSSLQRLAGAIDARAGMEFEMIVPDVGSVDDDGDLEPDYDQDQRTRSFSDIRDFFYDGDYNGRRDVEQLITQLEEEFIEWADEQIFEEWQDEGIEYLRDYIDVNDYFDEDDAREEATNALQAEYGDDISPEDFQKMLDAIVKEKLDEFVQDQWDNQGQFYDEARETFVDERRGDQDESDWLDEHYGYMSDIERNFDITWPHWHNPNEGSAEGNVEAVANEFEDAIGRPVYSSTNYHGARRSSTAYSLEPDGSLDPENSGDQGLEFISPPLPVNEILADLKKVKAWADSRGCYTNKSTGLHINISVPNYSLRDLDYVKLALLLGDEYILKEYGRMSNTYAKSAIGKVRDKIKQHSESAKELMDKMRQHMEDLATKAIHSGTTDKYTSINTKDGYIEFRSPGGDWLGENFDKVENTLLRFVVALDAAIDPEKYRSEYLKKLYKLLEPTAIETKNPDTIKYFADYVAGKTPKAALRSFIKQAQLERKIKKDPTGGQKYWWRVGLKSNPNYQIEVVGSSPAEAIDAAMDADTELMRYNRNTDFTTRPVRPYSDAPVRASVGEPEAIGQRSGPTVGGRPSNPEGAWILAPQGQNPPVPLYRFNASGIDDANNVVDQWNRENSGGTPAVIHYDSGQFYGQPASSSRNELSQTEMERRLDLPDQTGDANYEIIDRRTGRRVFVMIANTEYDARRKYADWLSAAGYPIETEDYGFREIALPGSTVDLQRQRAAQAQQNQQTWNIVNRNTGEVAGTFTGTEHQAEDHALNTFGHRFIYDVVPTQQQSAAPQAMGAGREFAGWKVLLPNGREVYRFSGVGNSQADANRIAADWLRSNGMGVSGEGYEVVPVWNEA